MLRSLVTLFTLLSASTAFAAEGGGVPLEARSLFGENSFIPFLTNSLFTAILVTVLILWFVRGAMKKTQMVPGGKQNLVEFLVEFLYKQTENIVGPAVAPRAFPLLATIFLFVTIANWCGLLPGVGTVGFSEHLHSGQWAVSHIDTPLIRPATADMNLTVGIALCSLLIWFALTMQELGFVGFIKHTFAPKGVSGVLKHVLLPIFILVGLIEIVSILFRPVSLSLRLYGNVFAGENLLHVMGSLIKTGIGWLDFWFSVLLQLPFYFLEILVGVLQGMVFALLNAVFIKLSTTHDEEHGHDEAHGH